MNRRYRKFILLILVVLLVLTSYISLREVIRNKELHGDVLLVEENVVAQNVYKVTMAYIGNEQLDMDEVLIEINKLTLKDLNMTLDINPMSFCEYRDKQQLMLVGRDELDIQPVYYKDASALIEAGLLLNLYDYIDDYGQNLVAQIGEELAYAGQINGFLYGIPTMKESQTRGGIVMRKDIVDQYQIDVNNIHSYEDLTAVYAKIHQNEPTMKLLVGDNMVEQVENFDS